ncbi:hypothetical protein SRABI106_03301 [Rahnella aquatilis]|nr:hypothetical protein SRABI106_03301 [Rahnella aquatilis]
MRMIFTQHVTDGTRGFFEFGVITQAQLGHRVNNTTLHRLEPVTDKRQRAVHDDVHGIVEIGVLSKRVQS